MSPLVQHLKRHVLLVVCVLALLAPLAATAAGTNQPEPPKQVAQETVAKLLKAMKGRRDELRNNPAELRQLVDRILVPVVDLNYMSQLVLGRYWRSATPEQRKRFKQAFKSMLVRTYGNALLGLDDEHITYMPVRADKDATDITFRAKIETGSGDTVPVSLNMHIVDGQWKVYDGHVANFSFVTNYRSQFSSYVRKHGLEKLIQAMEKRYGTGGQ